MAYLTSLTLRRAFVIVCIAVALYCGVQLWHVHLLYTNTAVRTAAQNGLEHLAAQEGWLLSDLNIESLTDDSMRVQYRAHHRGSTLVHCMDMNLSSLTYVSCDAS